MRQKYVMRLIMCVMQNNCSFTVRLRITDQIMLDNKQTDTFTETKVERTAPKNIIINSKVKFVYFELHSSKLRGEGSMECWVVVTH